MRLSKHHVDQILGKSRHIINSDNINMNMQALLNNQEAKRLIWHNRAKPPNLHFKKAKLKN